MISTVSSSQWFMLAHFTVYVYCYREPTVPSPIRARRDDPPPPTNHDELKKNNKKTKIQKKQKKTTCLLISMNCATPLLKRLRPVTYPFCSLFQFQIDPHCHIFTSTRPGYLHKMGISEVFRVMFRKLHWRRRSTAEIQDASQVTEIPEY